ncbi:MAG: hypothetical protein Q8M76_07060, partial [Spirochaetaceae bacterium]|nr:hypothetical protein [Spirochaetaceae bacterium]
NSHRAALVAPALVIALLALFVPASCSKPSPTAQPAAPAVPAEAPKPAVKVVPAPQAAQVVPAPTTGTPTANDAPLGRPAGNGAAAPSAAAPSAAAAKTPAPPRPALVAAMKAFGLAAPPKPRMPEDYSLGPLQSYRPTEGAESESFAAAVAFMDAYAQGKLDKTALLPEAREALSVLLTPPSAATGAAPYRLGKAKVEGQAASYLVRLPRVRDAPRVEGLLSLRAVESRWYVEALVLDPPAPARLAFDPSALASRKIDGN